MALDLDPATREALMARIRFCRDLGLTELYRRPVDPALLAQLTPSICHPERSGAESKDLRLASQEETVGNDNPAAALQLIRDEIGECTRCPLHKGRNKIVFGDGNPTPA